MKPWLHKIEVIVDRAIPYLLVLLLGLIIGDIFFLDFLEHYNLHAYVIAADYLIIGFFGVDLIFKWFRVRRVWPFLKRYWLDILAVFPFMLFFRFLEEIYILMRFRTYFEEGQRILHQVLETQKEVVKIAREVEKAGKISRLRFFSRLGRYTRFIRPLTRAPRFMKAFAFYEKPIKAHHRKLKKKLKKGFKKIKKKRK